ncbi:hypothetical protein N7509_004132 [Penicillium cosmopolitanum]|uniref:Peroxisomal membrane protein PEX13 n=1 Tax=Penicillium cosmopolitanum TaxID=1131564 RepID=A0A9X0BC15_9EURO|nr:uncharacterized protein N7509_004132 [Penicillium cosmopolitanum]KAJ5404261.1 hypothetical protein N7509_004132 [Penicillium cosmopolitanum]
MASVSPPKPWERAGAATGNALTTTTPSPAATAMASSAANPATSTTSAPDLPSRPNTLNSVVNNTASNYSPYGASRLGSTGYGGYGSMSGMGGMGGYSSPYSRFGSMGGMGSMYGGYGGMGGMYGGMGGMGGMYGGMPGQDPNDPNSLTNSFSQSTQATFHMIESIVGAFGGFAQMLESTYMATHSSFFDIIVLTCLSNGLGRRAIRQPAQHPRLSPGNLHHNPLVPHPHRETYRPTTPADATALTPSAFAAFMGGRSSAASLPDGSPAPAKPSKKPFFMFLVAVFGLPYLMGKLIKALARSQEEEARRRQQLVGPNGEPGSAASLDPTKLDFCRVLYDYSPETQESNGIDLAVKKGDIVAVLSKSDPMGNASEWWRCRARDGGVGYLPGPYLETIQRRPNQAAIEGPEAAPLAAPVKGAPERTQSLSALSKSDQPPELKGKMGDISPESFQKSTFYS